MGLARTRTLRWSVAVVAFIAAVIVITCAGRQASAAPGQASGSAAPAPRPSAQAAALTDDTVDPAVWGKEFPLQYETYLQTVDQVRTKYGGSEALPRTPDQADPRSVV